MDANCERSPIRFQCECASLIFAHLGRPGVASTQLRVLWTAIAPRRGTSSSCRTRRPDAVTPSRPRPSGPSRELLVRANSSKCLGLRLTLEQSSRLWGLERAECEALLHVLVHRKFLSVRADGKYGRTTDGDARDRRRVAKASLKSGPATARSAGTPADRRAGARSSLG